MKKIYLLSILLIALIVSSCNEVHEDKEMIIVNSKKHSFSKNYVYTIKDNITHNDWVLVSKNKYKLGSKVHIIIIEDQ